MKPDAAMKALQRLDWEWHGTGAVVTAIVDGLPYRVWVPVGHLAVTFDTELTDVGCPLDDSVGAYQTVAGLWGSIKRGFKKATRAVKKVVPKRIRRAATKVYRTARRYARKGIRFARQAGKILSSREAQAVVLALGVAVPVLAPASGAMLAAQEAMRHIDTGVRAAKAVQRGVKATGRMIQAMRQAESSKRRLAAAGRAARQGNQGAQQLMGALATLAA